MNTRIARLVMAGALIAAAGCSGGGGDGRDRTEAAPAEESASTTASTATAPRPPRQGAQLDLGINGEAYPPEVMDTPGLDPALAGFDISVMLSDALWDSLTEIDAAGDAQPAVATSWSTTDQQTWRFTLDPDARYHDDTPVVAADFVEAWIRLSSRTDAPLHYLGEPIVGWGTEEVGVRAVDERTLEVRTAEPFPLLPELVASTTFSPRPRRAAGEAIPPQNGPYEVTSQRGLNVVAERNEHYSGTAGRPDRLVTTVYPGYDAYLAAIRNGEVDVTGVTVSELTELGAGPERMARGGAPGFSFLDFNQGRAPVDRPEVRRALSLAIDRTALLAKDSPGAVVATGYAPPDWQGARADLCPACAFDPAAARAELAKAGIDAARVTIELGSFHDDRAEDVAQMWRDVLGVTVAVDASGGDPSIRHAVLAGWFPDYPDTASYLAAVTSRSYPPPTERTVALIEGSLTTADPAARQQALDAAQQALSDEFITAPLSFAQVPWYVGERVVELPFDALSVPQLHRAVVSG